MKTKLVIYLERSGITNYRITELIAKHNEGINLFLIKEVNSVVKGMKSEYSSSLKDLKLELIEDQGKLNVYENGKDLTYTIQENEYYTLAMVDNKNKIKVIAGQDALLLNPVYNLNS